MTGSWTAAQMESEYHHPSSLFLVAEHDSQVLGYVSFRTMSVEAELMRLVVLPVWRRQGIAGRVLESGLKQLAEQGVQICFLEVRRSNIAASSLYIRHGFSIIGARPKYYRQPMEDAVLMQYDMAGSREGG